MIALDGNAVEGDAQLLRNAIILSTLIEMPIRVYDISIERDPPGLTHMMKKGIQLVAKLCNAEVTGLHIGSTLLEYSPSYIAGGTYRINVRNSGDIGMLLLWAIPVALWANIPVTLMMRGGTNTNYGPQIEYMVNVYKPMLKKFGGNFDLCIKKRGYYPMGGGWVNAIIYPVESLGSVTLLDRGSIAKVKGVCAVSGLLSIPIAELMEEGVREELQDVVDNVVIRCYKEDYNISQDNGSFTCLWAVSSSGCVLGGDKVGEFCDHPREVGRTAAARMRAALQSGACLGTYTQDQAIVYMCLAGGESSIRVGEVTPGTRTAIHMCELLGNVKYIIEKDGDTNIIKCTGMYHMNKHEPEEVQSFGL